MTTDDSATIRPSALDSVLLSFERSLEQPLVPGELANWSEAASERAEVTTAFVLNNALTRHGSLLKQISKQDGDLANRVAGLLEQHRLLEKEAGQLANDCRELAEDARKSARDESHFIPVQEEIAKRGIRWIIDVRKQEAAVTTWFQEALSRDRGIGD